MLTIIFGLIITGIIIFLLKKQIFGGYEPYGPIITIILTGLMLSIIGAIMASTLPKYKNQMYMKETSIEYLVSINDGSSQEGRMFLGSGKFEDKLCYTFYKKSKISPQDTNKVYEFDKIDAKWVKIVESEGVPRIVRKKLKTDVPLFKRFYFVINHEETIIYIPYGSIIKSYNLDGKI